MRNAFIQAITDIATIDTRVVLLMAEVGYSVVEPFQKQFPDRFYNTGIAEQDLVSVAAGMALGGLRPVAYSMSSFLPSRAFEQIKIDVCYQDIPVVLAATGAGLSYGGMGATHHAAEESALMRTLPNLAVLLPACSEEIQAAFRYAFASEHPTYISMSRALSPKLPAHDFVLGVPVCYRTGPDAVLFAVGYSVVETLKSAEQLDKAGIKVSVYGLHTLCPLDESAICAAARSGCVFVIEEQQRSAGMGGEIARCLLEGGVSLRVFRSFAIPDRFAGPILAYSEQLETYGLSAWKLSNEILSIMEEIK